jgi:hypothetical protein
VVKFSNFQPDAAFDRPFRPRTSLPEAIPHDPS